MSHAAHTIRKVADTLEELAAGIVPEPGDLAGPMLAAALKLAADQLDEARADVIKAGALLPRLYHGGADRPELDTVRALLADHADED